MNLIDIIQKYGLEYVGRFYSTYRGVVIDNTGNDPGVLRVTIPSVQTGVTVWARSKAQMGGPGIGAKYLIPDIGSVVNIEFEFGDPMRPLWSYSSFMVDEIPDELKSNSSLGIVTPNGNKIYLHDKDGELHIEIKGSEGKDDLTIEINKDKDQVIINGGTNGSLMNVDAFDKFVEAVLKDLLVAKSGTNVSNWLAKDRPKLEDKRFTH